MLGTIKCQLKEKLDSLLSNLISRLFFFFRIILTQKKKKKIELPLTNPQGADRTKREPPQGPTYPNAPGITF